MATPDFRALAERARVMNEQYANAGQDLARIECTGHGGGGLVAATVNGDGRITALSLDPSVIDPDDAETLADLVIEACNAAQDLVAARRSEQLTGITDGLQGMVAALRATRAGATGAGATGATGTPGAAPARFPGQGPHPRPRSS